MEWTKKTSEWYCYREKKYDPLLTIFMHIMRWASGYNSTETLELVPFSFALALSLVFLQFGTLCCVLRILSKAIEAKKNWKLSNCANFPFRSEINHMLIETFVEICFTYLVLITKHLFRKNVENQTNYKRNQMFPFSLIMKCLLKAFQQSFSSIYMLDDLFVKSQYF